MADRFIEALTLGSWEANCYVVGDRDAASAIVVDPGEGGAEPVRARLAANGVACDAILLTHGHIDHMWSVPELAEALDVEVFLHPQDCWLWDDPGAAFAGLPPGALEAQLGLRWRPPNERLVGLADGDRLVRGAHAVTVRHTPGHTPGSCVFLMPEAAPQATLLSGDLIFAGSVGRTDFPRGSWDDQMAAISRVVLPLDDEVAILSGHGPATTVGAERRGNPFVRELVQQRPHSR